MSKGRRGWAASRLSETEILQIRAAGLQQAEPAFASWRAFRDRVLEGDEEIGERRLLPLVCRNLLHLGHSKDPYLTRAYAEAFGANTRMLDLAAHGLKALHDASIRTMVLKGAALLQGHYRDVGARPMSDVDILVPDTRVVDALDILEGIAWRGDSKREWLNTESHADSVTSALGLSVDLHRHATCEGRFAAADEAFFQASVPLSVAGAPTSAMCPGDQLLHSVIHGLRWSIARSPIWVIDAATILRGDGIDVRETLDRAARLRLSVALRDGLEIVRAVLGAHGVLDALLGELHRSPQKVEERIEHRFRVREPSGILGVLPNLWFGYQRSQADGRPPLSRFPSFLSKVWRVNEGESLGPVLVSKAWRRIRSRRGSG